MNPAPPCPLRGLYLLTPDEPDTERLLARVRPALAAGATLLQYRNKSAGASLRREQALALLSLCRELAVPLLINDDWRLALAIGADGAHLGADDGELGEARAALGDSAILGASCYADLARAERAVAAGASYVAFGAFFQSSTKPQAARADLALLRRAKQAGLPMAAIGGILPGHVGALIAAGADLIAVIDGVFAAEDSAAAARSYVNAFSTTIPTPSLA